MSEHTPYIREAIRLSQSAAEHGNHPFGALLVRKGEIVLRAENTVDTNSDITGHAELNLVREGHRMLGVDVLGECILYTSTEPCAMCAGSIYWAGIKTVVFACSAGTLRQIAGGGGLNLPCAEVFARGTASPPVAAIGPILEDEAAAVHRAYWPQASQS